VAELVKLSIARCAIAASGSVSVDRNKTFDVMINPSNYSHAYSISYNKKKVQGQIGSETKFSTVEPEKVGFDIVLDGTGAVEGSSDDVTTQMRKLTEVVYQYDGEEHEPPHLRVLWGSFIFFGRLDALSSEYSLFKPSGDPLRAKVKLSFVGFMSREEEALKANRSSPDLTHVVSVRAGDTLPLLCQRIYKDASYYLEVARINDIVDFRSLPPGVELHFPPLR
jgi:hypothetical protein